MSKSVRRVPIELAGIKGVWVEVTVQDTEENVGFGALPIDRVLKGVSAIGTEVLNALRELEPDKTTIEFSVAAGLESGQLSAIWVRGRADANLTVTMEWERGKNLK